MITDVCLCEYTSHGHCGLLTTDGRGRQRRTVELLARTAISQARAGADIVAPSDMMDGRVGAIRRALDDEGFDDVADPVATRPSTRRAFYGPFREAAGLRADLRRPSRLPDGPRQLAARRCARSLLDVEEGADMLMVKPALPYLDVLARIRDATALPIVAYSVSGEYAMLKAAAAAGVIDRRTAVLEALTSIRRAGADVVITYHAKDVARWLQT